MSEGTHSTLVETGAGGCRCAWAGCGLDGTYRAPRDRKLDGYVFFCLEHVRIYNAKWNFHEGLGEAEIESELRSAATWDRPTWKMGTQGAARAWWRDAKVEDPFGLGDETPFDPRTRARGDGWTANFGLKSEHRRALKVLELDGPLTLVALKARYKVLVKRFHPDANGGGAEDRMKTINAAYALLKSALLDRQKPRR